MGPYFRNRCLGMCLLITICFSLADAQNRHADYATGEIIDTVFCINQANQSYALYLPLMYSDNRSWPVILIFDPAARGRVGVSVFREGAEKFGYIILCSNNSSNRSGAGSVQAADAMMEDVISRFSCQTDRIYTAGFSGGSRFALRYAIHHGTIRGVIGCGAGVPSGDYNFKPAGDPFCYYGISGNRDLNLQDLISTEKRMKALGHRSHLQVVEGGHQWPPGEELALALAWLTCISDGSADTVCRFYLDARIRQMNDFLEDGRYLEAADIMEALQDELFQIDNTGKLDELRNLKSYKKQEKERSSAYETESRNRRVYIDALEMLKYSTPIRPDTIHTRGWWDSEIKKLGRWEGSKHIEISRMASRLMNMIEIHCAENLWDYVELDQEDKAGFIMEIWLKVTPDQLWANWNAARFYSVTGNKKRALKSIEWIISTGKAEKEWFNGVAEFDPMRNDPDYLELMRSLK